MPAASLFGDWQKAAEILKDVDKRFQAASKVAMLAEGQFLRAKIVEGLRAQAPGGEAFSPLSKFTLAVRRFLGFKGTKALIHRGDLRNSIVSKSTPGGDGVFVGVLRTTKSSTGKDLVNVAEMQEFGFGPIVVPITPKSRRFFHAALEKAGIPMPHSGPSSGGVAVAIVRTPPRPFLRPAFKKYMAPEQVRARFFTKIVDVMGEDLGTP